MPLFTTTIYNMLNILELRNSIVASDKTFHPIQNQVEPNQNQTYSRHKGCGQILTFSDILGIKSMYTKWGIQWWLQIRYLCKSNIKPNQKNGIAFTTLLADV